MDKINGLKKKFKEKNIDYVIQNIFNNSIVQIDVEKFLLDFFSWLGLLYITTYLFCDSYHLELDLMGYFVWGYCCLDGVFIGWLLSYVYLDFIYERLRGHDYF